MTEIDYKQKYLKYKNKYLKLKAGNLPGIVQGVYGTTTSALNLFNPLSSKSFTEKSLDLQDNVIKTGSLDLLKVDYKKRCDSFNNEKLYKKESQEKLCKSLSYCDYTYKNPNDFYKNKRSCFYVEE